MSHHTHHDQNPVVEPDPADSSADVLAALSIIVIAVTGILFFISRHGAA